MSKKKNFTKEQKHLIKQCMIDADIVGLSKLETIEYVKSRLNLEFSESSYKKFRSEILKDDESNVKWISYYARQGFVEFYRKRISEMEMVQKETFKQWSIETNKPDSHKDKNLILKLVTELRANNQQLTSLGMVTPIIATIKNIIDDDKKDKIIIGNASKFNNDNAYKSTTATTTNTNISEIITESLTNTSESTNHDNTKSDISKQHDQDEVQNI